MNENKLLGKQLNGKNTDESIKILFAAISNPNININTETDAYLKTLSGSFKSLVLNDFEDGLNELNEAFTLTQSLDMELFKNNVEFIGVQLAIAYSKKGDINKASEYSKFVLREHLLWEGGTNFASNNKLLTIALSNMKTLREKRDLLLELVDVASNTTSQLQVLLQLADLEIKADHKTQAKDYIAIIDKNYRSDIHYNHIWTKYYLDWGFITLNEYNDLNEQLYKSHQ